MVVLQGRKTAPCEHPWSTMVSMASYPLDLGSPVIRSITICVNRGVFSGTVILWSGVFVICVMFLFCWQVAHPLMYWSIQAFYEGQKYLF